VRRARGDAVSVAGREDALLAGDDHRQAALHHDAELLDLVLVRLDDGPGREVEDDERRVIGLHDAALHARTGFDQGKVARGRVIELRHHATR